MSGPSVLVYERYDPGGESLRWLESRGVIVEHGPGIWETPPNPMSTDELIRRGQGCIGLMGGGATPITAEVLEELPDLRYISKYGIGVDSIDISAASSLGVMVANSPIDEIYEPVCEHTITLILAVLHRLPFYTPAHIAGGGWRHSNAMLRSISGLCIGLVGYGRIGKGVAARLDGWGAELIVCDPYLDDLEGHERVEMDELLRRADVISLHMPATPDTRHMIDARALTLVKADAIVVNTSRGVLIDTDALADAISEGRVAGAGLDVYETEPAPPHRIFSLPNVVATPHIASWTEATLEAVARAGAENMLTMIHGQRPLTVVS